MFQCISRSLVKKGIFLCCSIALLLTFPGFVLSEGQANRAEKSVKEKTEENTDESTEENTTQSTENHIENQWEATFQEQISHWISEISLKEPLFKQWSKKEWESYPFGPGSRQWIVLILDQGTEIGYLIVGEEKSGQLQLIEYGKSDQSVLSQIVTENGQTDESFVYGGLLWAKKENDTLVDLLTYEAYEHVSLETYTPNWVGEDVQQLHDQQFVIQKKEKEAIVYYPSSIKSNAVITEPSQFATSQSYLFQVELLPRVTALYSLIGIHNWESESESSTMFVGLQDEGIRFLSYRYLNQMGTFSSIP
jgi:hypothetical protein